MATASPAIRPAGGRPHTNRGALGDAHSVCNLFLEALVERDFAALASCMARDVRFRALLPRSVREALGAEEATRCFQAWFGQADRIERLDGGIRAVADRVHMTWRFRVHDDAGARLIEQQAYATVQDDRVAELNLLCSGFRPELPSMERPGAGADAADPVASARLDGGDAGCATLTPLVKAAMRDLPNGQILEIISRDPSAEPDVASWCRLTGNSHVATRRDGVTAHIYIRKT